MSYKSELIRKIPDPLYIRIQYLHHFGKLPNLHNPSTFNEKMQWLKIHDHNPVYTTLVDKVKVKSYIADKIGEQYVIPTIGVWDSADKIDFSSLPNQFVIKCNHDSHGVIVCRDKTKIDVKEMKAKLQKRLNSSGYYYGREWPYKNVEKRILAEEYISDGTGELIDYKVHNFNGEPKVILVCRNRFGSTGLQEDFFDTSWRLMDVKRPNASHGEAIDRPEGLDLMLELSKTLSKGFPFLRTDFYYVKGRVLFGELTLYPASGYQAFIPESYDKLFGEWIDLRKR